MEKLHQSSRYSYPSVAQVAEVLALARHWVPWELEAPVRHRIRFLLVLQGCPWGRADWIGHSLVARGRIANSVRQPAGYDSDYDLSSWTGSADCVICDRRFIPKRSSQETCSEVCRRRQRYLEERPVQLRRCERCNDQMAVDRSNQRYCSVRSRTGAQKARDWARHKLDQITHCGQCGVLMPPSAKASQLYCSPRCSDLAEFAERRRRLAEAKAALERYCDHCGAPLPPEVLLGTKFCSATCRMHAFRARKRNGHANGHAANGHTMKMIPDPTPTLDPTLPAMRQALYQIRLELMQVRHEYPELTEHEALREARRRCHRTMVAAADQIEALDRAR